MATSFFAAACGAKAATLTAPVRPAPPLRQEELGEKLAEFKVKAPESGNDITAPYPFNLMFPTQIGPSGKEKGFMRPETAQGIFVNFKYAFEQSNGLPFGVAQIGKAYRNEIAPRAGLIRQREFNQAEIEFFVHPEKKDFAKFARVADLELALFTSPDQLAGGEAKLFRLGDAVKDGTVNNETLGYFIGRTAQVRPDCGCRMVFCCLPSRDNGRACRASQFLLSIGISPKNMRFRQHLPTEMAHYASDCWDAEIEGSAGWTETVGIADRACFDLNAHSAASKVDLSVDEELATPIEVTTFNLSKKVKGVYGKPFKKEAGAIMDAVNALPESEKKAMQAAKSGKITVNGTDYDLIEGMLKFEKKTTKVRGVTTDCAVCCSAVPPSSASPSPRPPTAAFAPQTSVVKFMPSVIEPSFGVDRMLSGAQQSPNPARLLIESCSDPSLPLVACRRSYGAPRSVRQASSSTRTTPGRRRALPTAP